MEQWHSKALGDGVASAAPSMRIQKMFSPVFVASGLRSDMAVFSRYDLRTNVVTAYFSPSASRLAELFGARPCDKPAGESLGLLVGAARCWEIHFPERKRRAA